MAVLRVAFASVFNAAEKNCQTVPHNWISFSISGLKSSFSLYPDGTPCPDKPQGPHLTLVTPGFSHRFEYGSDRENWVVMFACPGLSFNRERHQICFSYRGSVIPVRHHVPVNPLEVDYLRNEFSTLTELFQSGIPVNQLEADLIAADLFRRFLQRPSVGTDDAELLRQRLAADTRWTRTIAEHCRELGIGRDRVRKLFIEQFKIEPGEYRIRQRMQHIFSLFAHSRMNLKEIAFETGMKNASHLSLFLRKRCGKTPSQLCREYRWDSSGLPDCNRPEKKHP